MKYKNFYLFLSFFILTLIISFSLAFSSLIEKTNEPLFCIKCHIVKPEYFDQIKGGLHNNLKCIECHLPYDYKIHFYARKVIDGIKDLIVFYTGLTPEKIYASSKTKEIIQKNCIRCHQQMISQINISERKCWSCHRRITHHLRGFTETF